MPSFELWEHSVHHKFYVTIYILGDVGSSRYTQIFSWSLLQVAFYSNHKPSHTYVLANVPLLKKITSIKCPFSKLRVLLQKFFAFPRSTPSQDSTSVPWWTSSIIYNCALCFLQGKPITNFIHRYNNNLKGADFSGSGLFNGRQ